MKKILLSVVVLVGLVGCSEKNEEYYFQNLDKAQDKMTACKADAEKAFKNKDEKAFEKVRNDAECRSADSALQKQRQIDYEKAYEERKLQEKLEAEKKAEEKRLAEEKRNADIAQLKKQLDEDNKAKSWQDKLTEVLKMDCTRVYNPTLECIAAEQFKEEAMNEGLKSLEASSFDEVVAKENEFCSRDKREGSACTVWGKSLVQKTDTLVAELNIFDLEATNKDKFCGNNSFPYEVCRVWSKRWDEQSALLVKVFMDDFDVFKETYNACVADVATVKSQKLGWSKESEAMNKITRYAPCYQASQAYSKRGLGYSTSFKESIE